MKVIVTSTGEPTTELCRWALERNGFEVMVFQSDTSLWQKLHDIYNNIDEDFLRVDADVIVNKNLTPQKLEDLSKDGTIWWWQFVVFDWYKMDIAHTTSFIRKVALPSMRLNINRFKLSLRPETDISRIKELHNPRRMQTYDKQIVGIHGYGIPDMTEVKRLKEARNQMDNYDFELAERLNAL